MKNRKAQIMNQKTLVALALVFVFVGLYLGWFETASILGNNADYYLSSTTETSDSYLMNVQWSGGSPFAPQCQDKTYISFSGDFENYYRNQNVAPNNYGYKVEETIGNNPPEWLEEFDGERFDIQSIKFQGLEAENVIGTCEFDYVGKDRMQSIDGKNVVIYDWYVRPINCQFTFNISTSKITCNDIYWQVSNQGSLVVEFPKENYVEDSDSYTSVSVGVEDANDVVEDVADADEDTDTDSSSTTSYSQLSISDKINLWIDDLINSIWSLFK